MGIGQGGEGGEGGGEARKACDEVTVRLLQFPVQLYDYVTMTSCIYVFSSNCHALSSFLTITGKFSVMIGI